MPLSPTTPKPGPKLAFSTWYTRPLPTNPLTPLPPNTSILITGATSGLGLASALKFASLGASTLVLGVRSLSRGHAAAAHISSLTIFSLCNIHVLELDLARFESVRGFVRELEGLVGGGKGEHEGEKGKVKEEWKGLDIAILNAGVSMGAYERSEEGWEMTLQVNVLSTALLGILLLPLLKETSIKKNSVACLELVGSDDHKRVEWDWVSPSSPSPSASEDSETPDLAKKSDSQVRRRVGKEGKEESILQSLNAPSYFTLGKNYAVSKLLVMYVMQGLVDLSSSPNPNTNTNTILNSLNNHNTKGNVSITTTCPGLCNTNLFTTFPWYIRLPFTLLNRYLARTTEEGSRSIVRAALLGMEGNGGFWKDEGFDAPSGLVTSEEGNELQSKIWKEILEVLRREGGLNAERI